MNRAPNHFVMSNLFGALAEANREKQPQLDSNNGKLLVADFSYGEHFLDCYGKQTFDGVLIEGVALTGQQIDLYHLFTSQQITDIGAAVDRYLDRDPAAEAEFDRDEARAMVAGEY